MSVDSEDCRDTETCRERPSGHNGQAGPCDARVSRSFRRAHRQVHRGEPRGGERTPGAAACRGDVQAAPGQPRDRGLQVRDRDGRSQAQVKFGVVVFPGTWSDRDCGWVIDQVLGGELRYLWHKDADLKGCDCIILPGGFAYGDYLRTGAIARLAPVMEKVSQVADRGGLVLGICTRFQVPCRASAPPCPPPPNSTPPHPSPA